MDGAARRATRVRSPSASFCGTEALPALLGDSLGATARYDGPALWIVGGRSDYVRADDAARIAGHFPGARIERIAGSGHNPHIDARTEFVRFVRGLL